MRQFIHLHVHSMYSTFDGMTNIWELVRNCHKMNMPAVALTDHGTIRGFKDFLETCEDFQTVKPIYGCEFYLTDHYDVSLKDADHTRCFHLILLAKNFTGYKNLKSLYNYSVNVGLKDKRPRIDHVMLEKYHEGLICTSACLGGEVAQAILADDYEKAKTASLWYKNLFGEDFYLEVDLHPNYVEKRIYPKQQVVAKWLFILGERLKIKVVAANDVHFLEERDADINDALLSTSTGSNPDDPNRFRYTGQEWLKNGEEMEFVFGGYDFAMDNTLEIADKVDRFDEEIKKYEKW